MSTRPTTPIPTWSTAGTNIEPSAGKKSQGWVVNERPPAEWLNWLQNSAGAWLQFLADVTSGSPTPDLLLNFANADLFTPLIDLTAATAGSQYRLVARLNATGTTKVRLYVGNSNRRFMLVSNAVWGGSSWVSEVTTATSTAIALYNDGSTNAVEFLQHPSSSSSWADNAWASGSVNALTVKSVHATGPATSAFDAGINANDIATATLTASGIATFNNVARFNAPNVELASGIDLVHPSPQPQRKVQIHLLAGTQVLGGAGDSIGAGNGYDVTNGYLHTTPGVDRYFDYALTIPRDTDSWNVEVLWMTPDSGHGNTFTVFKQSRDLDTAASTPPPVTNMGSRTATVFSTTLAQFASLLTPITEAVQPYNNNYWVRVQLKGNASGQNRLYGLRLVYDDPGPRNG
jgi:hypothetical protein